MHPDQRLRLAVKSFYAYLGSVALAGLGPVAASRLVEHYEQPWRIAGVIIGVGSWIPIMFLVAWIVREGDEFVRRIHLVAFSISFGGALVLVSLVDWLERAHFIEQLPLMVLWVAIAMLWVFALFGAKRYYERPR